MRELKDFTKWKTKKKRAKEIKTSTKVIKKRRQN